MSTQEETQVLTTDTILPTTSVRESKQDLLKRRVKIDIVTESYQSYLNKTIVVCGWFQTIRWQKKLTFGKIYDSAQSQVFPLQVLFDQSKDPQYFSQLQKTLRCSSVILKGKLVPSPKPEQPIELQCEEYYIIGPIKDPDHHRLGGTTTSNVEYLRGLPQLECHTLIKSITYDIRSGFMEATDIFFRTMKRMRKVEMPTITFSECEGGCNTMQVTLHLTSGKRSDVPVMTKLITIKAKDGTETKVTVDTDDIDFFRDFFGSKASLTVSSQLELETQLPLGDVYTITKAFRGEPSQTTRHLCEFSMLEFEMGWTVSAEDIMNTTEEYIKFYTKYILDKYMPQLEFLQKFYGKQDHIEKLTQYVEKPFVRITHADAVDMMRKDSEAGVVTFKELPEFHKDMGSEHEKYLTDVKFLHPVIVMRYPKAVKAFYMPVLNETLEESRGVEHVDSFDILYPFVGELVGGSQRIHEYDELMQRITELNLDIDPLRFYIDLRTDGSMPHGGMGMGIERAVKGLTAADSVKDCVSFPRFIGSGRK